MPFNVTKSTMHPQDMQRVMVICTTTTDLGTALNLPLICVCGDARQDASFEAAFPIYAGLDDMFTFTGKCLTVWENLLQRCLFIELGSMEVIVMFWVASILVEYIVTLPCYLAGSTHKLFSQMADCCVIMIVYLQSFITCMTYYLNYGLTLPISLKRRGQCCRFSQI